MVRAPRLVALALIALSVAACAKREDVAESSYPDTTLQSPDAPLASSDTGASATQTGPSGSRRALFIEARRLESELGQALQAENLALAGDLAVGISNRYAATVSGAFRAGQRDSLRATVARIHTHARGIADESHALNLAAAKDHFRELQNEMRNAETIANEPGTGP